MVNRGTLLQQAYIVYECILKIILYQRAFFIGMAVTSLFPHVVCIVVSGPSIRTLIRLIIDLLT